MTRTKKTKLLGAAEQFESKNSDWMFQKAQELGFTDSEIGGLRATYNRKTMPKVNSNLIKRDD